MTVAATPPSVQTVCCRWNSNVNLPTDPNFIEALQLWQQDLERGVYSPKLLGSITAVSSGRLSTAPAKHRCSTSPNIHTGQPQTATRPRTVGQPNTSTSTTAGVPASRSTGRHSSDGDGTGAAVTPAVFQGSGENALQALEGLVTKHLVTKPHLTLMQLQRAVQGISCLDSPCQLAAIGVLVTAGYWLAAMQVMREDRRSSHQPNAMTAKLPDAEAADTMPGNVACTFTAARSLWTLLDMYCVSTCITFWGQESYRRTDSHAMASATL